MKIQKRNFVVEIRSSRRRPRAEAKSIWGDMDFKALSREAEAAHFLLNGPSSAAVKLHERSLEPELVAPTPDANIETTEIIAETYGNDAFDVSDGPVLAEVQPVKRKMPVKATEASSRQRRTALSTAGRNRRSKTSSMAESAGQELVSADDISLLEAENRRLTLLLAQRLRDQNFQLRGMIERLANANP